MLYSLTRCRLCAAAAMLVSLGSAFAATKSHDPPFDAVISYDGSLSPGIAATGSIAAGRGGTMLAA